MKAGLFEIADIFVINKADRPGADNLIVDIQTTLRLHEPTNRWDTPIVATQAVNNIGIEELYQRTQLHHQFLEETGELLQRRQKQLKEEFIRSIEQKVTRNLLKSIEQDAQLSNYLTKVESGEIDPYTAADEILKSPSFLNKWLHL
jgi:LAO/AO transport system kinase